jgi:hypothetical protein
MYMNLLQVSVKADVNTLPFNHLLAIISPVLVAILVLGVIVFIGGISIKKGDKETYFGGIRGLLGKRDEDTNLKEDLKRFTDDVDHETQSDLFDYIDDMDSGIDKVLIQKHCDFTKETFSGIVKQELRKRVRRNSLRERLMESSRGDYIDKVLKDIEKKYKPFQSNVASAPCEDQYLDFSYVKEAVRNEVGKFFDEAVKKLIAGYRKKRERYEKEAPNFKTVPARVFCCDRPDQKNKGYIEAFTGLLEPAGTWYGRGKCA